MVGCLVMQLKLVTQIDSKKKFICVSGDITFYKQATLKINEVEHLYQQMINSSPSLILI